MEPAEIEEFRQGIRECEDAQDLHDEALEFADKVEKAIAKAREEGRWDVELNEDGSCGCTFAPCPHDSVRAYGYARGREDALVEARGLYIEIPKVSDDVLGNHYRVGHTAGVGAYRSAITFDLMNKPRRIGRIGTDCGDCGKAWTDGHVCQSLEPKCGQ